MWLRKWPLSVYHDVNMKGKEENLSVNIRCFYFFGIKSVKILEWTVWKCSSKSSAKLLLPQVKRMTFLQEATELVLLRVHICFISIIRETPWCAFMHVPELLPACQELAKRQSHRVTSAFKGWHHHFSKFVMEISLGINVKLFRGEQSNKWAKDEGRRGWGGKWLEL